MIWSFYLSFFLSAPFNYKLTTSSIITRYHPPSVFISSPCSYLSPISINIIITIKMTLTERSRPIHTLTCPNFELHIQFQFQFQFQPDTRAISSKAGPLREI